MQCFALFALPIFAPLSVPRSSMFFVQLSVFRQRIIDVRAKIPRRLRRSIYSDDSYSNIRRNFSLSEFFAREIQKKAMHGSALIGACFELEAALCAKIKKTGRDLHPA